MASRPSDTLLTLADRLRARIAAGEAYVRQCVCAGRPVDRSTDYLDHLRAHLAEVERRWAQERAAAPLSHPSQSVPAVPAMDTAEQGEDYPGRRWETRPCPGCGQPQHGPWEARTRIWCGYCLETRREAEQASRLGRATTSPLKGQEMAAPQRGRP